jgi:ribosomal protein L37AE/L43A
MPSVRCPSCDTAQHVEAGSDGYTCSSCGASWSFVRCRNCGARFHAKPEATTWTCPRCGLLQDASAETPVEPPETASASPKPITITDADLDTTPEPPPSAFPPGLGLGEDDEGPEDAFAMPFRESTGRPPWIWVLVGVAALIVAVLLFVTILGGDDAPDDGAQVSGEQATATMCGHVQQIQVFRDDALGAAAEELQQDRVALRRADERQTARLVRQLIVAIDAARGALANQEPTAGPFADLQEAIDALPCSG